MRAVGSKISDSELEVTKCMLTPEERRDFLLKDLSGLTSLLISYIGMRLAALGAILTLIGVVISFSRDVQPLDLAGIYGLLLLIVFTAIRVISALNRNLYVVGEHLCWIEEELEVVGFHSNWRSYVQRNPYDSGSYAFVIALRAMNLGVSAYVVFNSGFKLSQPITAVAIVIAMLAFIWNELHIRKQLDPKGFAARIGAELRKSRQNCLKKREQISGGLVVGKQ